MKINTKLSVGFYISLALPIMLIAVRFTAPGLFDIFMVRGVENGQALWLLFCGLFTLATMLPLNLNKSQKIFWMWSAWWWFVLLGRSISWGRDYFPDVPHIYFRVISIFWLAPLVILLFKQELRGEIKLKMKEIPLPLAIFSVAVGCFLISDAVEHKRMMAFIFLDSSAHQDIVEELYEIPFMVALFLTAQYYMRMDKREAQPVKLSISTATD